MLALHSVLFRMRFFEPTNFEILEQCLTTRPPRLPSSRSSSNPIFSHRNRERAEYKMLTLELELETLEYNQNQSSLSLIQIWHKYIPGDGMEWWPQCQTLWFFFLLSCPEGSQHTPRQSQSPSCWRKKDCDPLGHLCLPHHGKWWGISEERKKET